MSSVRDIVAINRQIASLLDGAPMCAAVLDAQGKAKVVNKVFVEYMGPLLKFSNYEFAEAASKDEGKVLLKAAINAVCSGASPRERCRNIEMLTRAGEAGLPVKMHFDWFIGSGEDPGEVTLYGDPCSTELLKQREKVCPRTCTRPRPLTPTPTSTRPPIHQHPSGCRTQSSSTFFKNVRSAASGEEWEWEDLHYPFEGEGEEEEEDWEGVVTAKTVGRKGKEVGRWAVGPGCSASLHHAPPTAAPAPASETDSAPAHPGVHAAPRVAPAAARAAARGSSPASPVATRTAAPATARAVATESVQARMHHHVQHAAPRVEEDQDEAREVTATSELSITSGTAGAENANACSLPRLSFEQEKRVRSALNEAGYRRAAWNGAPRGSITVSSRYPRSAVERRAPTPVSRVWRVS